MGSAFQPLPAEQSPLARERLDSVPRVLADPRATARESLAPHLERVRHVREIERGVLRQVPGQAARRLGERRLRARRQEDQLPLGPGRPRLDRRGFLQDHVRVRPPDPEGAHPSAPGRPVSLPLAGRRAHVEGASRQVHPGVRRLEVEARGNAAAMQREGRLDEARHARRHVQVTDVRLHGADRAVPHRGGACPEGLRESGHLDRVPHRRPRPVRLHVPDRLRRGPRQGLRRRDHLRLPRHARRRVARLRGTVVVDRRSPDHREDRVAVRHGVGQPLQDHDPDAVPRHRARGLRVEGAAVAVRGRDAALLVQVATRLRKLHPDPARERHVALVAEEAPTRHVHRHEGRRARGLDRDARPAEVELVGNARGQEVLVAADPGLERVERAQHLGVGDGAQVGVGAHSREDPDRAVVALRVVSRRLQRLVGALEEEPLLRVDDGRFTRAVSEERRVEELHVLQHSARLHVLRARHRAGVDPGRQELLVGEGGDRLPSLAEVPPEGLDPLRSRETTRHPDDRHPLVSGRTPALLQRPLGRPRQGGCPVLAAHVPRQRGDGRVLEELHDRDLAGQHVPQPALDTGQEERVPSEVEEVLGDPDLLEPQRLPPDCRDRRFQLRPRGDANRGRSLVTIRLGQGLTVHLAARVQGQGLEHHEGGRHHVFGQQPPEVAPQVRSGDHGAVLPGHVADQPLPARRVVPRHHHRVVHRRVAFQHGLDLARLDPEASHLHLLIATAQELDPPVGTPPDPVARPVQALAGRARERVGHESQGGEVGATRVPPREARTADVQLPGDSHGNGLHPLVQHVGLRVVDGAPDRGRSLFGSLRFDLRPRGHDARFRGPVVVEERKGKPARWATVQRVPSGEQGSQPGARRHRLTQHRLRERCGKEAEADARVRHPRKERGRRQAQVLAGDEVHARPRGEVGPDLPDRRVERGARELAGPIRLRDPVRAPMPVRQVDESAVLDLDSLGCARGARRVDHVREAARADRDREIAAALPSHRVPVRVEANDPGARLRKPGHEPLQGQENGHAGVLEQERKPLRGWPGSRGT